MTNETFKSLVMTLSGYNCFVTTDLKGFITYADSSFCELTGYDEEEVLGKPISLLNSGYTPKNLHQNLWEVISVGIPWKWDVINKKKNGTLFRVENLVFPFQKDGQIEYYGSVWLQRNSLIDDGHGHIAFDYNENSFYLIFNNGEFHFANQSHQFIQDILTDRSHKLALEYFKDLLFDHPNMATKSDIVHIIDNAIAINEPVSFAIHGHVQTEVYFFELSCNNYGDNCTIYLFQDITNSIHQRQASYHQSRLASAGEMLSSIAHQWRQPLNVISSSIINVKYDLVGNSYSKDSLYSSIDLIEKQVQHLSQTIHTFTTYLKPKTDVETFFVNDAINVCVALLKPRLKNSHVSLNVMLDFNLELKGRGDELEHIIINLINNAIDAFEDKPNDNKEIVITSVITKTHLAITIQDNAGGIKPDVINRIFEPYFTTKDASHGTGLGLYISKKTINEHFDGNISVHNDHQGACFELSIPIL